MIVNTIIDIKNTRNTFIPLLTFILLNISLIINIINTTPKPYTGIHGPNNKPLFIFLNINVFKVVSIINPIIEYIKNTSITLELDHVPDWNNTQDRKSLINVIKFLIDINVIKVKDETKVSFIESKDAQALYEVTGISNYVMRLFDTQINDIVKPEEFIKNEFLTQDEARGDVRRYRNFRNILYTPMLASKDMTISDLDYIKKMLPNISSEIVEMQKSLQPGNCVAFGKAFKIPLIIRMDLPNPEPSSSNCDVVNRWR